MTFIFSRLVLEFTCLGPFKWSIFWWYLKPQGYLRIAALLGFFIFCSLMDILCSWWIAKWALDQGLNKLQSSSKNCSVDFNFSGNFPLDTSQYFSNLLHSQFAYLGIYALIIFEKAIFQVLQLILLVTGTVTCSRIVHDTLLGKKNTTQETVIY